MGQKAGVVTIDLNAGTAQLIVDMEKASSSFRKFGNDAQRSGHDVVTSMQAASAGIRLLDNPMGNNIRAVERFLTLIPGIGPALQAAFPVVGAIGLGEVLGRLFEKLDPLPAAEKKLEEASKQADEAIAGLATRIEHLNVQQITDLFGKLQGLKLQRFYDDDAAAQDRIAIQNLERQIDQARQRMANTRSIGEFFSNPVRAFNPLMIGQQFADMRQAQSDYKNVQALQAQLDEANERLRAYEAQRRVNQTEQDKTAAGDTGRASSALITNEEHANSRFAELAKQRAEGAINAEHLIRQAQIDGIQSSQARIVAAAEEELVVAREKEARLTAIALQERDRRIGLIQQRAGAESLGKTPIEQQEIQIKAQGDVAGAAGDFEKRVESLKRAVADAAGKVTEAKATVQREINAFVSNMAMDANKLIDESLTRLGEVQTRLEQTSAQRSATSGDSANALDRLAAEREYESQVVHTREEEIAYAQRLANIEAEIAERKVQTAIAERDAISISADPVKYAEAQLRIEQAIAEQKQANYAAQTKVAEAQDPALYLSSKYGIETTANIQKRIEGMQHDLGTAEAINVPLKERLSLEQQILEARISLAAANGQADNADKLAAANVALHQTLLEWKSIGIGDIAMDFERAAARAPQALGGAVASGAMDGHIGREVGNALKGLGKELFGELLTQALEKLTAELALHLLGITLQNGTQQANTAALIANTAALNANAATQGMGAGANAAGGVAGAAASAAGGVMTGMLGPIIGGAVGGVISGIFTLIGDNKIVKAVNGTTAAVLSLKGTVFQGSNALTNSQNSNTTTQQSTGFGFGGFMQGFFNLPDSNAVPVRIVQSWGDRLGVQGLFGGILGGLFGFADGTDSAPGGWSWVGERGPELMNVPRGAQIIPNHRLGDLFPSPASTHASVYAMPGVNHSYGGVTFGDVHLHGVQDVREMMRGISQYAKTQDPSKSPFAR